ncbi:GPN-loop GTPase 1 [Hanseniaspora opuntiae]|jgi:GPN-loop GTPase|uniref:GPN-loop GTPase n=1 Tax=Hanseniaspora opuntiae TaxID=211096 RepID=A0A1E5RSY6_9ASCO|nr:GPN-loop GTPase 1 [Hanseniaspora opuntiae]
MQTVICIGMAGSGKTTFMQRLNSHLHAEKNPPYVINLDPATLKVPFGCHIDIRDSIKYKKVMENYDLGPNGAIVTSLNLFSTKIDQVMKIVEKRSTTFENCIIDTPGQIECFVWSASGSIITESFASQYPTVIAYIVDTPRNQSPSTFMSNMLYACSILYKTKLPMILVFNKNDVVKADFAIDWMKDFEVFQDAILKDKELQGETGMGSGYMGSLINSMSLMLEEFYSQLDCVQVSSATGAGFDEFMKAVKSKGEEYNQYYKKEREAALKRKEEEDEQMKKQSINKLMKDLNLKSKEKKDTGAESDASADVISDLEEGENDGIVYPDEEEEDIAQPSREYTFSEDREMGEVNDNNPNLQAMYQDAMEKTSKDISSETAENIAKYIRG